MLYGSSGYGTAIADVFESWPSGPLAHVVAYIDDVHGDEGLVVGEAPVMTFAAWAAEPRDIPVFVTLGDPRNRRMLVERVVAAGGHFGSYYERGGAIARDLAVGTGSMVLAHGSIGAGTVLGNHVHVMPLCAIGPGVTIGDFVTLCPMAAIVGRVVIEDGVFIGVGARIVNESEHDVMTIGAGATIAAGAVVLRTVLPGETLLGNPATDLRSLAQRRAT